MTEHPIRIQRKRTSGWRKPANTICISRPSPWGNPFRIGPKATVEQREHCVAIFRIYMTAALHGWVPAEPECADMSQRFAWMATHLDELRGKNLCCWCKLTDPCHGDVLLELANKEQS